MTEESDFKDLGMSIKELREGMEVFFDKKFMKRDNKNNEKKN